VSPVADSATDVARVAVVDDHGSVRLGLSAACVRAGHQFVEEGANVAEFIGRPGDREIDLVVLDLLHGDVVSTTDNVKTRKATDASVFIYSIAKVDLLRRAVEDGILPGSGLSAPVSND